MASHEIKIKELSTVKLNVQCSAILQNELPPKEKDPRSFILPCIIGSTIVSDALADLGTSISIMPFSLFKWLGLGNPKPINMVIEMADRSMQSPKEIIENVLVKINKFIFPVDFIILDIIKDDKVLIILGRPMLATAHARIDVFDEEFGSFLKDNDLLLDLESQDIMSLSPLGSAILNNDSSGMFCNPNSNSSISVDDFIEMDDVWDNLDFRDLTNEANKFPFKHEFLSSNNMVGFAINLHVFIGDHQFLIDFIILENIKEFVEKGLTKVLFGQPFKEHVGIADDRVNRVIWFKIRDDQTIFNMPRTENRFGFYQGCLELGEECKHDQEVIDWIKGHATFQQLG
ncbi:retrovirus-related pol polyprotein from transposon TNT 1-94, partial [Tanacetum coccineum]